MYFYKSQVFFNLNIYFFTIFITIFFPKIFPNVTLSKNKLIGKIILSKIFIDNGDIVPFLFPMNLKSNVMKYPENQHICSHLSIGFC